MCIPSKNENIVPIRLSEQKRDKHVNLLYIQDAQDIGHFAWIKNLSRLVSSQLNKHNGQKYICDRCLHYFYSNEKLQSHTVDCGKMNDCAIRLPSDKDKWLAFNNYNRKEQVPFVAYTDLECVLRKMDKEEAEKNVYQHQVFSIAYYVHCSYDNSLSAYHSRREANCVAWFAEELKNLATRVKTILSTNLPMINLTRKELEKFNSATQCHILTDKIKNALKDVDIRLAYYSINKNNKFIKTHKDPIPSLMKINVVYKINYLNCDASYVGQTGRKLNIRIKEHKTNIIKPNNNKSVITA
ncbi:uncharacterized protein [Anoplolepis gracilipes]|uniref:uncharacterized protein n=1 Tax=Anoplolepis gracilipes TaxID=354296 RepID=UPI003B9F4FDA